MGHDPEFYEQHNYCVLDLEQLKIIHVLGSFPTRSYNTEAFYYNMTSFIHCNSNSCFIGYGLSDSILEIDGLGKLNWYDVNGNGIGKLEAFDLSEKEDFRYVKKYFDLNPRFVNHVITEDRLLLYQAKILGRIESLNQNNDWELRKVNLTDSRFEIVEQFDSRSIHPHFMYLLNNGNLLLGRKNPSENYFCFMVVSNLE